MTNKNNNKNTNLDPWFITGFFDAESCFTIGVTKDNKYTTGWRVKLLISLSLHEKDEDLLLRIRNFFNVGCIYVARSDLICWSVTSLKDLEIIINHFDYYPLVTKKQIDYENFKQAFFLLKKKEHLTNEGLIKIVNLKSVSNFGLSLVLKEAFSNIQIKNIEKPILTSNILNPNWISGFVSGDGSFGVQIFRSKTKIGEAVKLSFTITQHIKDKDLMSNIKDFFNCGSLIYSENAVYFKVTKLSDLTGKIIPFFKKYGIFGVKYFYFYDFIKISEIMLDGRHKSIEGINVIKSIKSEMNK